MKQQVQPSWMLVGGLILMVIGLATNGTPNFVSSLAVIAGLMFLLFGIAGVLTRKKKTDDSKAS